MEPRVTGLRSIELGVTDLTRATRFYENCWGLRVTTRSEDAVWMRATGPEHHVLVLRSAATSARMQINLATDSKNAVDHLYRKLIGAGVPADEPRPVSGPEGGYGFVFRDLDRRSYAVTTGVAQHEERPDEPDKPTKLSHIVLNSPDREAQSAQFVELLGFTLSDRTHFMDFIRCSRDHHSLAYTTIGTPTLNHCAYELPSHDGLMRAAGRLKRSGFPVEWGVGRHGPGNNVFAYFIDPEGYAIEYTAEVEQVDETYRTGMPEDWQRPPEFHGDSWGFAGPASERFRRATGG